MHQISIMFTSEDVTGAAHIGGKLIDFVETAIDYVPHEIWVPEIAEGEIVSLCLAEARELEVRASDPESFPLKPPNKVMTDKTPRPADEGLPSRFWHV